MLDIVLLVEMGYKGKKFFKVEFVFFVYIINIEVVFESVL